MERLIVEVGMLFKLVDSVSVY